MSYKNKSFKTLKENKAITLIALVITIIVLLILAGVTISAISGNENIMEKANESRSESAYADELDAIKLAITNAMAQGLDGKVSDVNLRNALQGIIDDEELENITGDGPWTITTKLKKTYEINGYGQIEPAATPTDIYVTLDGDTLRFYAQKDNVSGTLYMKNNEPYNLKGEDFTDYSQIPWNNVKTSIKRVSFEDVIVPTSTARWFNECGITGIDHIERLNTRYVTSMDRMFRNCEKLESLDVSKFDTRNVTNMTTMFQLCSKLTQLDVSKFKTDKVTDMKWMFNGCSGLTELNVTKFNTRNVTTMGTMFQNCSNLTELDLSNWDTLAVTDMSYMFSGCSNLTTIYAGEKWNTEAVTQSNNMFYNCSALTGGAGTGYNSSYIDKTRAKIDGGNSNSGYFVDKKIGRIPSVGDFVDYQAGVWEQEEIDELNDAGLYAGASVSTTNFKFSGFKVGDNKDISITGTGLQQGWRVLSVNDDGTIDIIHAGATEAFYLPNNTKNAGYKSQYIMGGGKTQDTDESIYSGLSVRSFTNYAKGENAIANSGRIINADDLSKLPTYSNLRDIDVKYVTGFAYTNERLQSIGSDGGIGGNGYGVCYIRPVVTLKTDIKWISNDETHTTYETRWMIK